MPRFASLLTLALVSAASLTACSENSGSPPTTEAAANGPVITIAPQTIPDYRMVAAVVTNRDIGDARARIGGRLTEVRVREGDDVRPGQVVAVITDERVSLEAQAATASVSAAEAAATQARDDLARSKRLFASSAISAAALEAAQAKSDTADAELRAARAQAGAARAIIKQGEVTAPSAGKVTRIPTPRGSIVMPGEVVVAISAGGRVVRIELPEAESANLDEGGQIRMVDDTGNVLGTATIRQVYPAVAGGRVKADLEAPGFEDRLVGARVRVLVPAGERTAIVIPAGYVVTRYGADYVRVSQAGGASIEVPVQKGPPAPTDAIPDGVEILSGLRPGDQVLPAGPAS